MVMADQVPKMSYSLVPDVALSYVMDRINDSQDRQSMSLVSCQWKRIDSETRKHLTIALCYSVTPKMLNARFRRLESLKLKGKPRADMFHMIPENWGGYAGPWIEELSNGFDLLKELHFRRMVVTDEDIAKLVEARGQSLLSFKLDRCSGFSTDGLKIIASNCRRLRTLYLEGSTISNKDGEWLHVLATTNSVLMHLNLKMTGLEISTKDLELLACNCKSLISLKTSSECDLASLVNFFKSASKLEEFGGGFFNVEEVEAGEYNGLVFPRKLLSLDFFSMPANGMPLIYPLCATLKKLDLLFTFLNTEDYCTLIQKCPNVEDLQVRNTIGDVGLEVVGNTCKQLRRLRVVGKLPPGRVSQAGLTSIAVGCRELEYIAVYVSNISNASLEAFGTFSSNLRDFRLVLLDEENITDLPLDNGVRALLQGCTKLGRFSFYSYLSPGGLSDAGLGYIGEYSGNIRYMYLGNVGESDEGLMRFAMGCKKLEKLELRYCCFSEHAMAIALMQLPALRYVWVQYEKSLNGEGLRAMRRRYWNIEFIPPGPENDEGDKATKEERYMLKSHAQLLAYYSLAGQRRDQPNYVVHLSPA